MLRGAGFVDLDVREYRQWESIDVWIDSHEPSLLHREEIRQLFYNAPRDVRDIHPFEVSSDGRIRDWRWCTFSTRKPLAGA